MAERLVIHRDHTFEFKDERYQAVRMGPYGSGDDCWDVYRLPDCESVGQFYRLDELRELVERGIEEDWPNLFEIDPDTLHIYTVGSGR